MNGWIWRWMRGVVRRDCRPLRRRRSIPVAGGDPELRNFAPLHSGAVHPAPVLALSGEAAVANDNSSAENMTLTSILAPTSPDPAFTPPPVFGASCDGRFTSGSAWLRDGPEPGGCVAVMAGGFGVDPARACEIGAQRFDAVGGVVGAEMLVARLAETEKAEPPLVAALDDGRFAVSWRDPRDGDGAFRLSLFDSAGHPEIDALRVAPPTAQSDPAYAEPKCLARFGDGGFALSWSLVEDAQTQSGRSYLQCFAASGASRSVAVETDAPATVSILGATRFAAAWTMPDEDDPDVGSAMAAIYDEVGAPCVAPLTAGEGAAQNGAAIVALNENDFAVLWRAPKDGPVRGRRFDRDGRAVTGVFFLPAGAAEAADWGLSVYLETTPERRLIAVWPEDERRCAQPVRILPATLAPLV